MITFFLVFLHTDRKNSVIFITAEGFQRRRLKCEKLTDDRQRTPSDGKSSHCLWQGELKKHLAKSSPLKLLDQMNRNLVGSIYGRSSIKNAHFVPIG
jgi:hypothetical protein